MGVAQYLDAAIKFDRDKPHGADDPVYVAPKGHDRELKDGERAALPAPFEAAHKRRLKIRHGQDAIGRIPHVEGQ